MKDITDPKQQLKLLAKRYPEIKNLLRKISELVYTESEVQSMIEAAQPKKLSKKQPANHGKK